MICRHMRNADEEDFKTFDFFNDWSDTNDWLKMVIKNEKDSIEKEKLSTILNRLAVAYMDYKLNNKFGKPKD